MTFLTKKFEHQVFTDGMQTSLDVAEAKVSVDVSKKKNGRGRGSSGSGRGRGSRVTDQTSRTQISTPAVLASNGQLDIACHRVHSLL